MANDYIIADLFMNMSKVALVLTDTALAFLQREIKAIVNQDRKNEVLHLLSSAEIFRYKNTGEVLFYWHEVPWLSEGYGRESSFDVVFIENFLSYLSDNDYHFIRFGVDDDDIEEDGCYPDNFDCSVFRELCIRKNAGERITMPVSA